MFEREYLLQNPARQELVQKKPSRWQLAKHRGLLSLPTTFCTDDDPR